MTEQPPTVAFVGMTHLGLVSATAMADKGFATLCVDADTTLIAQLNDGKLPVSEPGLADTIAANTTQAFSSDFKDLARADVVYIAPDVPTDDTGKSDLSGIEALIESVVPHLSATAVLVILCQVPPGFTRSLSFDPARLYYQVETLVFGIALHRAAEPERYIIGCADPSEPLPTSFATVLAAYGCPVLPMRYESAELAKISINMFLVASVTTTNTLAELCEAIGADWAEIAPALRLDRRIGPHAYLKPGLGIAGGNLERDLATVLRFAERLETDAGVVSAELENSAHRKNWAADTVRRLGLSQARLAVWGLAYKENTHSIKNSPSIHTLSQLTNAQITAHDPQVPAGNVSLPINRVDTALEALDGADGLLVLTPWPAYGDIAASEIAQRLSGRTVLDPYGVLDAQAIVGAGLTYHTLGVGAQNA